MAVEKSERLINLTMALLATTRPLRKSEIFSLVQGYDGSPESCDRMCERDKDDLRNIGVPLSVVELEAGMDAGYRISPDEYSIPEMHFTPEESSLLAIASDAWRRSGYSGNSATTILKLQGAGVPVLDVIDNRIEFSYSPLWKTVAEAILNREVISFQYRRRDGEVTIRELEPYRLHFRSQRWYLIGKDRSRDGIRTFVLTRFLGGLTLSGKRDEFQIPNDFDSREHIVSALLETQPVTVIASGGAISILRRLAFSEKQIDDLFVQFEILVADEEEFLFQLFTQTTEFQVLSPPTLRNRAISLIEDSHGA